MRQALASLFLLTSLVVSVPRETCSVSPESSHDILFLHHRSLLAFASYVLRSELAPAKIAKYLKLEKTALQTSSWTEIASSTEMRLITGS